MNLTKRLKEKILNDNDFSLDLAKKLKVRQDWVLRAVQKNSNRLLLPDAIEFYKNQGFSEKEILTQKKD